MTTPPLLAARVYTISDCLSRQCDCPGAECRFYRCDECDAIVNEYGDCIDPRGGCPACDPKEAA